MATTGDHNVQSGEIRIEQCDPNQAVPPNRSDIIDINNLGQGGAGIPGDPGPPGSSGASGSSGQSGWSGASGSSGTSGIRGAQGLSGLSGQSGRSGLSGVSGISGFSSLSGQSGFSAARGESGFSGTSGTSGIKGDSGLSGHSGRSGLSGVSGYSGVGIPGTSGASGQSGFSGQGEPGQSGQSGFSGEVGATGPSGQSGFSGTFSGASGFSGNQGASGQSGFSGEGFSGPSGSSGVSGASGFSGAFSGQSGFSGEGFSGPSGPSGISGQSGFSGTFSGQSGFSGEGTSGTSGTSGFSGEQGTDGQSGASGFSGESGFSGSVGPAGTQGESGASGFSGSSGQSGFSGTSGSVGPSGDSGFSGQSGQQGPAGPQGTSGTSGVSGFSGAFSGISGFSGSTGASGPSGTSGFSGTGGASGFSGQTGDGVVEIQIEFARLHATIAAPEQEKIGKNDFLSFDPDVDNAINFAFELPDDIRTDRDMAVVVVYHVDDPSSGDVKTIVEYDVVADGADTTPASATGSVPVTVSVPAFDAEIKREVVYIIPETDVSSTSDSVRFSLIRDADDAGDTYTGDWNVESVSVRFTGFGAPIQESGVSGFSGQAAPTEGLAWKSYSLEADNAGVNYIAGYYDFPDADANLTESNTTQTHGVANVSYAAHAAIVAGGAGTVDAGDVGLRVNGTSITDAGVRVSSDSETLVSDITSLSTNEYVETEKKWLGQIEFELFEASGAPSSYSLNFNYGFAKYDDFGNKDFTIKQFEAVGLSASNDSSFDIVLFKHSASGWEYAATGFDPGGEEILRLTSEHITESDISNNKYFAFKRTGLSETVNGEGAEGVVICVSNGATMGFDYMDAHVGVEGVAGGPSGASGQSGFSGASFVPVPATAGSPGSSGQMAFEQINGTSGHLYIAVSDGTWMRAVVETF